MRPPAGAARAARAAQSTQAAPSPRRARRAPSAVLALAGAALVAGCGSPGHTSPSPAAEAPPGGAAVLATSLVTSAGTWAVAVMGGSLATHNNFWQLFARPAGGTDWKLVTPPGVPDNGGLVVANAGGQALITGFRPSQYLTFTPLSMTRDGGHAWSPTGPLGGALADVPDALATAPGTGHLLALLTSGAVQVAAPAGYTTWHTLTSRRAMAATAAGRHCGLTSLTAVTFGATGTPVLGGNCGRPGVAGIFAARAGGWQATGPAMPSAVARDPVTVLRLTQAGNRTVALLKAGSGAAAKLFAAWSADGGRWTLSSPLKVQGTVSVASFTPTEAIVLNDTTAAIASSSGGGWRLLPRVPAGTATVAAGPGGGFDALAVHRTKLTVWQLTASATAWHTTQVISVPIQFGSSS